LGPSSNGVTIARGALQIPAGTTFTHDLDLHQGSSSLWVRCSAATCPRTEVRGSIYSWSGDVDKPWFLADPGASLRISGPIDGGPLRIHADATELVGPNHFRGVHGTGGPITVLRPEALGPAGSRSTGRLVFPTAMTLPQDLSGTLELKAGPSTLTGAIGDGTTIDVPTGVTTTLSGPHPGTVVKTGGGTLRVTRSAPDPGSALVTTGGLIDLRTPGSQPAAEVLGAHGPGTVVRFNAAAQVQPDGALSAIGGGLIDLNGFAQTAAGLRADTVGLALATRGAELRLVRQVGTSTLVAYGGRPVISGRVVLVGAPAVSPEMLAQVVVQGTLADEAGGGFRVGGTNGGLEVPAGTTVATSGPISVGPSSLTVHGQVSTSTITVHSSLLGSGVVRDVDLFGVLSPAATSGDAAVLTARDVLGRASGTFAFSLDDGERLRVLGRLDLRERPKLSVGEAPSTTGAVHRVVDNVLPLPVLGTFKDLPEGAAFTADGRRYRISYVGGTGNHVTLTDLGAA
jgi:hypothetical protein